MEPDATVLVGKNGAGKSMVAEALVALRGGVAGQQVDFFDAEQTFALMFAEGRYVATRVQDVWEERFVA